MYLRNGGKRHKLGEEWALKMSLDESVSNIYSLLSNHCKRPDHIDDSDDGGGRETLIWEGIQSQRAGLVEKNFCRASYCRPERQNPSAKEILVILGA